MFNWFRIDPTPKTEVKKFAPKEFVVSVGKLQISHDDTGGDIRTGVGTRVAIDGVEIENVKSLMLMITPTQIVTATMEIYV